MIAQQVPRSFVLVVLAVGALLPGAACSPGPPAPPVTAPLVVSDRGGALRIYEIDRDAGVARLVGSERADDPAWSDVMPARLPDGRVVFVRDRGGRTAIQVTGPGLSRATPLPMAASPAGTAERAPGATSPGAAAPDACDTDPAPWGDRRLLFARAASPGAPRDLQEVALDGGAPRSLTRHPADDGAPCALHDGRTIVFISDRDGAPRLYRLDAAAPDPEATIAPLLPGPAGTAGGGPGSAPGGAGLRDVADGAPACLPDGVIVFARSEAGRPPQLMALALAGARPVLRQITDAAVLPWGASEPVALADGTLLLTAGPSPGAGDGRGPRYGVYRITGGGYNLSRVTRDGAGYDDLARALGGAR